MLISPRARTEASGGLIPTARQRESHRGHCLMAFKASSAFSAATYSCGDCSLFRTSWRSALPPGWKTVNNLKTIRTASWVIRCPTMSDFSVSPIDDNSMDETRAFNRIHRPVVKASEPEGTIASRSNGVAESHEEYVASTTVITSFHHVPLCSETSARTEPATSTQSWNFKAASQPPRGSGRGASVVVPGFTCSTLEVVVPFERA